MFSTPPPYVGAEPCGTQIAPPCEAGAARNKQALASATSVSAQRSLIPPSKRLATDCSACIRSEPKTAPPRKASKGKALLGKTGREPQRQRSKCRALATRRSHRVSCGARRGNFAVLSAIRFHALAPVQAQSLVELATSNPTSPLGSRSPRLSHSLVNARTQAGPRAWCRRARRASRGNGRNGGISRSVGGGVR